jgi:hypothetical protein
MQSKEGVQRLLSRAGCEVESDRAKERKEDNQAQQNKQLYV